MSLVEELAYSRLSEMMVLGYAMSSADGLKAVCNRLKREDFHSKQHQHLFGLLQERYQKGLSPDIQLLCEDHGGITCLNRALKTADVVDGDDTGVLEASLGLRLHDQPFNQSLVAGQFPAQHLDGHCPLKRQILREVHRAHPALTQQLADLKVVDALADQRAIRTDRILDRRALGVEGRGSKGPFRAGRLVKRVGLLPGHGQARS